MYFITDLDKTLIYSSPKSGICVERKPDKEITYVTKPALEILNKLLNSPNFNLVPCTLRSYEQTIRVDFIRNSNLKYIICDNGATIYVNGELDTEWDKHIDKIIDRDKVKKTYEKMNQHISENEIPIYMLKSNRDAFISIIFNSIEDSSIFLDGLISFVDDDFKIFKQGKKTYIVPKNLNKSIAVKYLKDKYFIKDIVTSGDSNVDEEFVKEGHIQILPRHSVFFTENAIVTKKEGINAGEEILQIIYSLIY